MDGNLEIRKLPLITIYRLVQILECGNDWKKLMSVIPKRENCEPFNFKYTYEHVRLIESAGELQKKPCSEIFLEEWGTSGRKQPTLHVLLQLLQKAELFRAAEYVAVELLAGSAPRRPETGPAAPVDVSDETIQELLCKKAEEERLVNNQELDPGTPSHSVHGLLSGERANPETSQAYEHVSEDNALIHVPMRTSVVNEIQDATGTDNARGTAVGHSILGLSCMVEHFTYVSLDACTEHFADSPYLPKNPSSGRRLGTGAFGSVYLGVLKGQEVAVKKLKENENVNVEKQFKNEVETLSRYRHDNLLPLLGYSCDGPCYCLVYAYMSNGSLQDRLACKGESPILKWEQRLQVAVGSAQGILYLHTAYEKPLIHRDIKSANILIDHQLIPKLGDFGLVRLGARGQHSQSVAVTTTIFGTSAYMAPEAFRGDISVKLDTFSFGVVLLELLTSLPPYDENRESWDLVTHVEDICETSIEPLLDLRAGTWGREDSFNPAALLYSLAMDCLRDRKHNRPTMTSVVQQLKGIAELTVRK